MTGFFKMCRLTEGILKQFGFTKAEHHIMLCHDWLSSRHVTIGTKAGKVLLLEDAELKQTIDVSSLIESADLSVTNGTSQSETLKVNEKLYKEHRLIIGNILIGLYA